MADESLTSNELPLALRCLAEELCIPDTAPWNRLREAADEIERLRRENAELTSAIVKEALAKDRLRSALERVQDYFVSVTRGDTHWDGCEYSHPQCVLLKMIRETLAGMPPAETRARPQAPIARITLRDGYIVNTRTYSPSLPDGEHDLYCAPEATAPYMRAEETGAPR